MEEQMELKQLTEQLIAYVETLAEKYVIVKETGKSGDFYNEVKPFADEVKRVNDNWRTKATKWIEERKPKNLYVQQIDSVHEHLETISVQAFFTETSKTRFRNLVASSNYVLTNVCQLLKEKGSHE